MKRTLDKEVISDYFYDKLKKYSGEFGFQYEHKDLMIVFFGEVIRIDVWYDSEIEMIGLKVDCFDVYINGKLQEYDSEILINNIKFKLINRR